MLVIFGLIGMVLGCLIGTILPVVEPQNMFAGLARLFAQAVCGLFGLILGLVSGWLFLSLKWKKQSLSWKDQGMRELVILGGVVAVIYIIVKLLPITIRFIN